MTSFFPFHLFVFILYWIFEWVLQAYASSEAEYNRLRDLPKIPSFHKFARREQYAQMDDSDPRERKWLGGILGRQQDCISERVRNWSLDFSATCGNIDNSRISGDNCTQRSFSNDVVCHLDLKEHSGESVAVESRLTKAWVDSAGSGGVKDYHAIEMWQSQALDAAPEFYPSLHARDEEDSNKMSRLSIGRNERQAEESSVSQEKGSLENQPKGAEHVKQAVVDYVASLLMPLYKARKIDKEGYKNIMKKSITKASSYCAHCLFITLFTLFFSWSQFCMRFVLLVPWSTTFLSLLNNVSVGCFHAITAQFSQRPSQY